MITETQKRELLAVNAYELAQMADCGIPDNSASPGAVFLSEIRDDFVELLPQMSEDVRNEIADLAPGANTHFQWLIFADLKAYYEGFDDMPDNPAEYASYGLATIAGRLVDALVEYVEEDDE